MMQTRVTSVVTLMILLAIAACAGGPAPTSPSNPSLGTAAAIVSSSSDVTSAKTSSGGGGGGGAKETLTGSAINGVVPTGDATADMSQFAAGGSTKLTVHVSNVNLPDGTPLQVTFDFKPMGTIALSRGAGSL